MLRLCANTNSWLDKNLIRKEGKTKEKEWKAIHKKEKARQVANLLSSIQSLQDNVQKTKEELNEAELRLARERKHEASTSSAEQTQVPADLWAATDERESAMIAKKLREAALSRAEIKFLHETLSKLEEHADHQQKTVIQQCLQESIAVTAELMEQQLKVNQLRNASRTVRYRLDDTEQRDIACDGQKGVRMDVVMPTREDNTRKLQILYHASPAGSTENEQDTKENLVWKKNIRLIPADSISARDKKKLKPDSFITPFKTQANTANSAFKDPSLRIAIVNEVDILINGNERALLRSMVLPKSQRSVDDSVNHNDSAVRPESASAVTAQKRIVVDVKRSVLKVIDGKECWVSAGGLASKSNISISIPQENSKATLALRYKSFKHVDKNVWIDEQKCSQSNKLNDERMASPPKERQVAAASADHDALNGHMGHSPDHRYVHETLEVLREFLSSLQTPVQSRNKALIENPYATDLAALGIKQHCLREVPESGFWSVKSDAQTVKPVVGSAKSSSENDTALPASRSHRSTRGPSDTLTLTPKSKVLKLRDRPSMLRPFGTILKAHELNESVVAHEQKKILPGPPRKGLSQIGSANTSNTQDSPIVFVSTSQQQHAVCRLSEEQDWVVLDNDEDEDEDEDDEDEDEWDLCIEGEKLRLKDASESWNVVSRMMLGGH